MNRMLRDGRAVTLDDDTAPDTLLLVDGEVWRSAETRGDTLVYDRLGTPATATAA